MYTRVEKNVPMYTRIFLFYKENILNLVKKGSDREIRLIKMPDVWYHALYFQRHMFPYRYHKVYWMLGSQHVSRGSNLLCAFQINKYFSALYKQNVCPLLIQLSDWDGSEETSYTRGNPRLGNLSQVVTTQLPSLPSNYHFENRWLYWSSKYI